MRFMVYGHVHAYDVQKRFIGGVCRSGVVCLYSLYTFVYLYLVRASLRTLACSALEGVCLPGYSFIHFLSGFSQVY